MTESKDYSEKVKDKRFQNWIKSNVAINIVKEGIQDHVLEVITDFHEDLLKQIKHNTGHLCSKCTTEQILPCPTRSVCVKKLGSCSYHNSETNQYRLCPNNACGLLRDEIRKKHNYNFPSWKNTRAENWCTNAWEIAKCYMPDGYSLVNGIADTDFNGIVSVMYNHKAFKGYIDEALCKKLRSASNAIRHSSNLLIEEDEMNNQLTNLTEFLKCVGVPQTKDAINNIDKLRKDTFPISTKDRINVVQIAKVETTQQERADMLDDIKQFLSKMQMSTQTSLHEINKKLPDSERNYEELRQNLKKDLIEFNNQNHSTIPVSPLIEEHDTSIVDFYVMPVIDNIDEPKTTKIASLWDIFYSKTRTTRFRNIYVTSIAGMGKTAFCKRLATSWCQAYSEESNRISTFVEEDRRVMKTFDYLFLIPLRETCNLHCTVNDMILHQVVKHLSRGHEYTSKILQDVLHNEYCLVILDGLDEWTHPISNRCCCQSSTDIPHRKSHEHCTILSTSRPWKLSILNLKTSQIDNHLSITGLGVESTKQLIKNSFTKLKTSEIDVKRKCDAFEEAMKSRSINELQRFPLILTYLICLWVDDIPFGRSRCEVYSNLVGLLLAKAEERKHAHLIRPPDSKRRKTEMPTAISKNAYCLKYYSFLTKLGHLAFETYIDNKNREFSLVFDRDVAKNRLGDNYLKFSLSSGLLTQHKIKGHYTTRRYRIAFAHKSFQEFLAALYMFTVNINSPMTKQIKRLCDSVPNILSISHFYTFLSGLCPEKVRALSNEIQQVIIASDITQGYRSDMGSWNYFVGYNETMKKLQNLHVTCTEECEDNSYELIEIQMNDFIIDSDFESKRYSSILQRIMISNKKNMKSIKVRNIQTVEKFKEVTNIFKGSGTQNLKLT